MNDFDYFRLYSSYSIGHICLQLIVKQFGLSWNQSSTKQKQFSNGTIKVIAVKVWERLS